MEDSGGAGRWLNVGGGSLSNGVHCALYVVLGLACLLAGSARAGRAEVGSQVGAEQIAYEPLLVRSLVQVRNGRLEDALDGLRTLLDREPEFELAQFVYADLLTSLASGSTRFGRPAYEGLRQEALARLEHYLSAPLPDRLPSAVLELPPGLPNAILVDLSRYRMYLLKQEEDGTVTPQASYYVSIGKGGSEKRFEGDERTPVGVYFVESYLPGRSLPALYGEGAFPVDYPNGWDRRQGRTGSGIWIHGTEWSRFSRAPLSSRGCVTLNNQDFLELRRWKVEVGTPVVFADEVNWVERDEAVAHRSSLRDALLVWEKDWESRDPELYLRHYAPDFRSGKMDRQAWARHKRLVNPSKRFIEVELEDVGMFRYPGEVDLYMVTFRQRYHSDSFNGVSRKRQFWHHDDGVWSIVQEENG